MPSRRGLAASLTLAYLGILSASLGGAAQSSGIQCLPPNDWLVNSRWQSPCLVANYLGSLCSAGYKVASLPIANHYTGPPVNGGTNVCQCNSVVYSLMSACAVCQSGQFLSLSSWSQDCAIWYNAFPMAIPAETAVPEWAYVNLTGVSFNVEAAQAIAKEGRPDRTGLGTPVTSCSDADVTAFQRNASHTNHTNMIIGAVVGSVLGAVVTGGIIVFVFRQRRYAKKISAPSAWSPIRFRPPTTPLSGWDRSNRTSSVPFLGNPSRLSLPSELYNPPEPEDGYSPAVESSNLFTSSHAGHYHGLDERGATAL